MTLYLVVHDSVARSRLNHPMRTDLREMIAQHDGPWTEANIRDLNAKALIGLIFWAKNGQLHVRAMSQADTLAETEPKS